MYEYSFKSNNVSDCRDSSFLEGCYPARLKKVLIVTAPLWFKAPFKVLRLFVREKLRDRVFTVSLPQLVLHIPPSCLPKGEISTLIIKFTVNFIIILMVEYFEINESLLHYIITDSLKYD